ncbi:MAG: hypothetical protein WAN86_20925 [Hyphomicrobiaceae bacterium]
MAPAAQPIEDRPGSFVVISTNQRHKLLRGVTWGAGVMSVIEKTVALLGVLTPNDVQALPPAKRRHFADMCKHLANLAEPRSTPPKTGILSDLRQGYRYE